MYVNKHYTNWFDRIIKEKMNLKINEYFYVPTSHWFFFMMTSKTI